MSSEVDVVVVGGGLAGLSAALTSARLGRRVAVVTGEVLGGQLVSIDKIEGVPGFPEGVAGYDLCPMTQEQAAAAGVEFVSASATALAAEGERWRIASAGDELVAKGVVLATGAAIATLGIPGEERLAGRGVSQCASCDAPLLRNKTAMVVGGGDSGLQEALTLVEHVAKVVLVERNAKLGGQASYRERVTHDPKVELHCNTTVTEILGDDAVRAVRLRGPAGDAEVATDAVFAFPGLIPCSGLVRDLVALDATGHIVVDATLRTAARGLVAAGNVRAGSAHRAAGAMGDGATAAIALDHYLASGDWGAART